MTPALDDVLDRVHVVALPMRVRFRGITTRELALIDGPAGWGEFGAFLEYGDAEAAHWLAAALDSAYRTPPPARRMRIDVNATVPAVDAAQVPEILARFPGARTAKVKVAEPGQTLDDDVARVDAVRALVPTVRVDANGAWTVDQAAAAAAALGPLEYLEQPCATVEELAKLRRRIDVPVAADESIRKAGDPLAVVRAGAADIAVLKVAPLGGIGRYSSIAAQIDIPGRGLQRAGLGGGHGRMARRATTLPISTMPAAGHRRLLRRGSRRARRTDRRLPAGRRRSSERCGYIRWRRRRSADSDDRPDQGLLSTVVPGLWGMA